MGAWQHIFPCKFLIQLFKSSFFEQVIGKVRCSSGPQYARVKFLGLCSISTDIQDKSEQKITGYPRVVLTSSAVVLVRSLILTAHPTDWLVMFDPCCTTISILDLSSLARNSPCPRLSSPLIPVIQVLFFVQVPKDISLIFRLISDSDHGLCHPHSIHGSGVAVVVPADDELWRRHDRSHHRTLASRLNVGPIRSTFSTRGHGHMQRRQLGSLRDRTVKKDPITARTVLHLGEHL